MRFVVGSTRGAAVGFVGPHEPTAWKAFFDRSFQQRRWTAQGSWRRSGSTWHARYARTPDQPEETIDVQFGPDGRGRLTGLLLVTPPTAKLVENGKPDAQPVESENL